RGRPPGRAGRAAGVDGPALRVRPGRGRHAHDRGRRVLGDADGGGADGDAPGLPLELKRGARAPRGHARVRPASAVARRCAPRTTSSAAAVSATPNHMTLRTPRPSTSNPPRNAATAIEVLYASVFSDMAASNVSGAAPCVMASWDSCTTPNAIPQAASRAIAAIRPSPTASSASSDPTSTAPPTTKPTLGLRATVNPAT